MIMNNWLNKWDEEKENNTELIAYENELFNAINESIVLEQKLKAINYRIEKLRENINELKK